MKQAAFKFIIPSSSYIHQPYFNLWSVISVCGPMLVMLARNMTSDGGDTGERDNETDNTEDQSNSY